LGAGTDDLSPDRRREVTDVLTAAVDWAEAQAPRGWCRGRRVVGTRGVVTDGMRILHDPQDTLAKLQKDCG